jgi:hypothetical protein
MSELTKLSMNATYGKTVTKEVERGYKMYSKSGFA